MFFEDSSDSSHESGVISNPDAQATPEDRGGVPNSLGTEHIEYTHPIQSP